MGLLCLGQTLWPHPFLDVGQNFGSVLIFINQMQVTRLTSKRKITMRGLQFVRSCFVLFLAIPSYWSNWWCFELQVTWVLEPHPSLPRCRMELGVGPARGWFDCLVLNKCVDWVRLFDVQESIHVWNHSSESRLNNNLNCSHWERYKACWTFCQTHHPSFVMTFWHENFVTLS